jgi:hypothetical protein
MVLADRSSAGQYLNNIIEQDHRFIKKLTRQMKGFKFFKSASVTLEGIEVAHMIRKQQFETSGQSAFKRFAALAGELCLAKSMNPPSVEICDRTGRCASSKPSGAA